MISFYDDVHELSRYWNTSNRLSQYQYIGYTSSTGLIINDFSPIQITERMNVISIFSVHIVYRAERRTLLVSTPIASPFESYDEKKMDGIQTPALFNGSFSIPMLTL